jgi:pimeloyl-ACP methyl ester carboxylesterase
MPYVDVEGSTLYYEERGTGEPVVFVHGNWSDHTTWGLTLAQLPDSLRAVVYDRRGTGRSPRTPEALTRRRHEDDLAALIESLGPAPAHVVAGSYGASTALGLAARRPELFRSLVAHEPLLLSVVGDDPVARAAIDEAEAGLRAVIERVEACDPAGGAEQFVEELALGPGGWAMLPELMREIMILNAGTTAEELQDPAAGDLDLEALAAGGVPILLTRGDESPAWFHGIVDRLEETIAGARVVTIAGAGYHPHATHPAGYAAVVAEHAGIGEVVR